MLNNDNFYCRVCGYRNSTPPWGEDGHTPLYDYCPCCGVEHGYQDASTAGAKKYREEWVNGGAKWHESQIKPVGWELEEQLNNVPTDFR